MRALKPGQVVSKASPVLQAFTVVAGRMVDADTAEFEVLDDDGAEVVATTQIDTTADRLGTGRYVTAFTLPGGATVGPHTLVVRYTVDGTQYSYETTFDVLSGVYDKNGRGYVSAQVLRDGGVPTSQADDKTLHRLILLASQYVERTCGRVFEPAPKTVHLDGHGAPELLLIEPIVAVADVAIDDGPYTGPAVAVDLDDLRIYNRHLVEELFSPDDRENPRIAYYHWRGLWGARRRPFPGVGGESWFPRGTKNVQVEGVFGYTDPPGPVGRTPLEIEHATSLLVVRNLPKVADQDARDDAQKRARIVSESTRDQSYKLGGPQGSTAMFGRFTGDPEIDTILARYKRPPLMGAA